MKTPTKFIVLALAMATAAPVAAQDRLQRVAALADRQEDRKEERKEERQERREARKEQKQDRRDDHEVRRDHRQERREDRREVRQERRQDRREVRQDRREDRLRARRYQDLYLERMHDQQRRWATYRHHDRFFSTPFSQRYRYDGRYWNTNRYGMEILREAANDGYAEGIRAGRADRYDNWRFDYRDSWAYRNPGYGYDGRYVDRNHYQHYFREGFRRGYEDGYYGRSQYGRHDNGQYFMIAAILAAILGT